MNVRFPLPELLGNRVVTTLLFLLNKALPPSGLALQVSLPLVTCDYFAIPLVMLSNAAPASSGCWHLLSRSVCPSVVCLAGIVEHPFFFCVYIFLLSPQLFCKLFYCLTFQSSSLSKNMLWGMQEVQRNTGSHFSEGFHVNMHLGVRR